MRDLHSGVIPGGPQGREGDPSVRSLTRSVGSLPLRFAPAGNDTVANLSNEELLQCP